MARAAALSSSRPCAADSDKDGRTQLEKAKDKLRTMFQRPSTGRTSALGRKVEKPGTTQPAGPSGQTADVQDRKHGNK